MKVTIERIDYETYVRHTVSDLTLTKQLKCK